jgi:PAS domain S-box-containing protein
LSAYFRAVSKASLTPYLHHMPFDFTADPFVTIAKAIAHTAQRLRDDEDNLRGIVEAISLSVTICDRDLTYRWLSTESAHFLGLRPEQMIGQPIAKVIGREAFETLAPYFERVLAGEYVEYEERIFYKGLGWRWVRAVYVPTFGAGRVVNGWVALVLDIDEQRRAPERIKEREERFRKLADTAPVLIWMGDKEDRCTFVNAAHVAFAGIPEAQFLAGWDALIHPDDRGEYLSAYHAALANQTNWHSVVRLRRHDGVYRWFEVVQFPGSRAESSPGIPAAAAST